MPDPIWVSTTPGVPNVADFASTIGLGTPTAGRITMLYRRRGGKDTFAIRYGGTNTLGTESGVNTYGAITSNLGVGYYAPDGSYTLNGNIEGVFAQTGTFSDTQITAILNGA